VVAAILICSGSGLCDEVITRSGESFGMCVFVWLSNCIRSRSLNNEAAWGRFRLLRRGKNYTQDLNLIVPLLLGVDRDYFEALQNLVFRVTMYQVPCLFNSVLQRDKASGIPLLVCRGVCVNQEPCLRDVNTVSTDP
jgi:hypothetical protein